MRLETYVKDAEPTTTGCATCSDAAGVSEPTGAAQGKVCSEGIRDDLAVRAALGDLTARRPRAGVARPVSAREGQLDASARFDTFLAGSGAFLPRRFENRWRMPRFSVEQAGG